MRPWHLVYPLLLLSRLGVSLTAGTRSWFYFAYCLSREVAQICPPREE